MSMQCTRDIMKTPCEVFIWYVLPGIRQELAHVLILEHELSQAQVAAKFGVSDAAISQYVSKKRGNIEFDEAIKSEIRISAKIIANGDESTVVEELCRICGLVKLNPSIQEIYSMHSGALVVPCNK